MQTPLPRQSLVQERTRLQTPPSVTSTGEGKATDLPLVSSTGEGKAADLPSVSSTGEGKVTDLHISQ